jgi:hypothetical protein
MFHKTKQEAPCKVMHHPINSGFATFLGSVAVSFYGTFHIGRMDLRVSSKILSNDAWCLTRTAESSSSISNGAGTYFSVPAPDVVPVLIESELRGSFT